MPKQRAFIMEHYFCPSSYTTVKTQFWQEFPNVTIPTDSHIKIIIDKFHTEYTLSDLLRTGWSPICTAEEIQVLCERKEEEQGMLVQHFS